MFTPIYAVIIQFGLSILHPFAPYFTLLGTNLQPQFTCYSSICTNTPFL